MANPDLWDGSLLKDPAASKESKKASPSTKGRKNRSSLSRGKGLKAQSDKQADLKKRWAFIKACFLLSQRRTNGYTSCMECGAVEPERLDLDHIKPTGAGGEWAPGNAQLLCRPCHQAKHRNVPEWTGRTA